MVQQCHLELHGEHLSIQTDVNSAATLFRSAVWNAVTMSLSLNKVLQLRRCSCPVQLCDVYTSASTSNRVRICIDAALR